MVELADAKFDIEYDGEDFTIDLNPTTQLLGQTWTPSSPPRFVYIFAHGLGAFVPFKKDFFYVILDIGGVVFGCDHLGHGRSPGARTVLTVADLTTETIKVAELAHSRYPDLPIILHGHSMGGLTVISTAVYKLDELRPLNIRGVIAEAPWITPCPSRPVGRVTHGFLSTLAWLLPSVSVPAGVPLFSDDLVPEWVKMCKESPLYSFSVSPKLYLDAEVAQGFIRENPQAWPAELPLLFLQGGNDALVDAGMSCRWAQAVADRDDTKVTQGVYPTAPHVLLKCPLRAEVARLILAWIEERIA
jgi:alpha-beta hydrolase superfamily lysophospholipase